jgi:hypothetical protein
MNIIPLGEGASALTLCDRRWLLDLRNLLRSHVEFFEGTRHQAHDLNQRAAAVTVWRRGRFQTVQELVDECADHNWNGQIYEAWVWETSNRVRDLMETLGAENDVVVAAVQLHARHVGYFEVSCGEAMDAIDEARRLLYGEP